MCGASERDLTRISIFKTLFCLAPQYVFEFFTVLGLCLNKWRCTPQKVSTPVLHESDAMGLLRPGLKKDLQDRYTNEEPLEELGLYFGIFDGHGGSQVSVKS